MSIAWDGENEFRPGRIFNAGSSKPARPRSSTRAGNIRSKGTDREPRTEDKLARVLAAIVAETDSTMALCSGSDSDRDAERSTARNDKNRGRNPKGAVVKKREIFWWFIWGALAVTIFRYGVAIYHVVF